MAPAMDARISIVWPARNAASTMTSSVRFPSVALRRLSWYALISRVLFAFRRLCVYVAHPGCCLFVLPDTLPGFADSDSYRFPRVILHKPGSGRMRPHFRDEERISDKLMEANFSEIQSTNPEKPRDFKCNFGN